MVQTPPADAVPALTAAAACADGTHTSDQLAQRVRSGRAFRVRRGVYVEPRDWLEAPPWQQYRIAVAATAMASDPVFCRETALLLHDVPLSRVPAGVTIRTVRKGSTGTAGGPSLTGSLSKAKFRQRYRADNPEAPDFHARRLRNVPTRRIYPALRSDASRDDHFDDVRTGSFELPEVPVLPAPQDSLIRGPGTYRVEPLGLTLIDTVSRMRFDDAVVALDWIKAHREVELEPWLTFLSTQKMRRRWQLAWDFARSDSESPGESRSRALIHDLGFKPPSLQVPIQTDKGAYRVDFCWEEARVIGEFDGRVKYFDDRVLNGRDPREVLYAEKQREDALRRAGWIVIRWTWQDLNEPARFAALLRKAGLRLRLGAQPTW